MVYESHIKDRQSEIKEYRRQFETGELDPEEVISEYNSQPLLFRAWSNFMSDSAWLRSSTAKYYLDDLVEED